MRLASEYEHLDVVAYLVSQGSPMAYLNEFQRRYVSVYMKHYQRREIRAASKIYFWWILRCFDMSAPSGIRMCLESLARHEAMCTS